MWRDYHWDRTPQIQQSLIEVEGLKHLFNTLPQIPQIEENLRRLSLLKSAVYSARIEGFSDTETNLKQESRNLLALYRQLYAGKFPQKLTLNLIKKFHKQTLSHVSAGGFWRQEAWAIFNQAGVAVDMTPPHFQLPQLMEEYVDFVNHLSEPPLIKAPVAQFIFEKIHPLPDGNGRVGRLISSFVLYNAGYAFKGQIPFEQYIEKHREEYYQAFMPSKNITSFIEFFLEALLTQGKEILVSVVSPLQGPSQGGLIPRKNEVLQIVKDHPYCSCDFIKRRFPSTSAITIHRDIADLIKRGKVEKLGSTRGAVYVAAAPGLNA